jgi:KDO2-lipid IV(A) lauroyltransferase
LLTRLAVGLLWLLQFLPARPLARVGEALGRIAYHLVASRRRVCLKNLELCFPWLAERERVALARDTFAAFGRSVVERAVLWWGSAERIERMVRIEPDGFDEALRVLDSGRPLILFAPHFVGLDAGAARLSMERAAVSMYARQKDRYLDQFVRGRRNRFKPVTLLSRQEGVRGLVREMATGKPCYYLPDLDFGRRNSVFVPFFGVPAATITGLAGLARLSGAKVMPVVTEMLAPGEGYIVRIYPAWEGYPSGDDAADARRMNAFIETRVRQRPEQYHWLHKRFKTRPSGEPRFY